MNGPLEKVIRPIVEGQIRGFLKEHPEVLAAVTWYKGKKHTPEETFLGSVSKRIIRDLLSPSTRARLATALLASCTGAPPTVLPGNHTGEDDPGSTALGSGSPGMATVTVPGDPS